MTATEKVKKTSSPATYVNASISEADLDQVIEDSFPASDAPSHTPITGLGPPADFESPPAAVRRRKGIALIAMAASAIVAVAVGTALWRRHSRSSGPIARVLHK